MSTKLVMFQIKELKKEKQIVNLCRQLGYMTRKLKQSDLNAFVGRIAGLRTVQTLTPGAKAPEGFKLPEMILFSGISNDELDRFLAEYRKAGIEPVSLKAVLTPYNSSWSLYELIKELLKEQSAMVLGNVKG